MYTAVLLAPEPSSVHLEIDIEEFKCVNFSALIKFRQKSVHENDWKYVLKLANCEYS
jgi:hypothetical protein